jgi:hypothetical protein
MLLILPISAADSGLAENLIEWILELGGLGRHQALVVGARQARAAAESAARRLDAPVFIPDTECEIGWPASSNHLWFQTVLRLKNTRSRKPFYWFEADNTPLRRGWLDDVETEYNTAAKPFLGAVQATRLVDRATGEFVRTDGEHVIGTCVYPGDFPNRSILWRYVRWDDKNVEPWDVYLRHEMRPQTQVSELIHNHWRTKNYEILRGGRIVCDPVDDRSVCGSVPRTAAVIHGCKDGSLIQALKHHGI